jgi:hypothetical protein
MEGCTGSSQGLRTGVVQFTRSMHKVIADALERSGCVHPGKGMESLPAIRYCI